MKLTILLKIEDDSSGTMTLLQIERKDPLTEATRALTLAESKQMLTEIHARFCKGLGVKFPGAAYPALIGVGEPLVGAQDALEDRGRLDKLRGTMRSRGVDA